MRIPLHLAKHLLAKRLPYSDHIVCLGPDGRISAQGTFAELNNDGGYVSSFSLPSADWNFAPANDDDLVKSDHKDQDLLASPQVKDLDSGISFSSTETACPSRDKEGETSRRTGDIQIYFYYIKSVGWWATLIFVVAIIGFVFCTSFPSK